MRVYINKRPPGFHKVPAQPVITLTTDEETEVRRDVLGIGDFKRKLQRKAEDVLIRHPQFERVDICSESGEVIRSVNR